jgi:3-oxoacyl-[acyl-carrier protein] reductase
MELGLADRVYLVTGGSKGLGFATARALVADGARVVLSSRSAEHVAAAAAELGDNAVGLPGDNADPELPERLIALAKERFGRLDGMLVSVGGPPPGGVLDTDLEHWGRAYESVFLGTLRLLRTVSAELGEGGAIALVLSTSVREPLDNLAISNGLRPGLAMVAKTLAGEVGPRGIRVVSLLPGAVATERLAGLTSNPDALAARTASIPLRRIAEPDEFGRVAAFVLSPAASYLTGITISVDGGATRGM